MVCSLGCHARTKRAGLRNLSLRYRLLMPGPAVGHAIVGVRRAAYHGVRLKAGPGDAHQRLRRVQRVPRRRRFLYRQ